ncbi:aspartate-semialdehyde dehydrogenase [bacterium (Candidatus Blackallbacteria) CG17_big_fil_post_rev_8_21_14_2_50_48_46]|uniref:Aspartate-semialdehyde dehydrogenase n=1 Tax=bacterium (Candidatus Blackallbacteria) CG17_big_fil_post_rev_8_21_14_2_50_48_46 TaxID=2014261 RepID=A0A2M7GBE8_9BACT|nr:MAG: aspartate-semialdehyde dehydrogenase [bacterium (Candidatus Blackallbacteria) CG18_big_fil_WC_8_21_14_2_50_49_26]PIW19494.1 MAG: aspartate-semialdehyde dehydrogenase [bacterium (Candidatus Blackallbacteria) CG17_big_fil_post_rev_8_21_14_2_50_48_46]PIW48902.1 MAG: aspartate-semialdehyde dehydrogenase [bacterium (Candidatus Blackallbacteria) CG13_big_fil_rev_8_21_14_2_50_49_14]
MKKQYTVGILGATGLVGREMIKTLLERNFPVGEWVPLASARSAGTVISVGSQHLPVQIAEPEIFKGIDFLFSSAGGSVSKALVPAAVEAGCIVIDNTSAFRMQDHVPLVVPEVNPEALRDHKGLIANPNCSTAQLVVVLKPLHDAFTIKRIVCSTYQAVSGAGNKAVEELYTQSEQVLIGQPAVPQVLPYPIAFNVIPFIGDFEANGYTNEEMKMTQEVAKIMGSPIPTTATCIRVPVANGHSESVNLEFARPVTPQEARLVLQEAPLVTVRDDCQLRHFPYPLDVAGTDPVYVGRIRCDVSHPNGLNLWIVADNLRKGAALNAVQIAEKMIEMELV